MSPCEYAAPTVPAGNDAVVMLKAGALIVSERAAVADADAPSVTFTVKLDGPAVVGVPDNVPPALKFSPAGGDPLATDHV